MYNHDVPKSVPEQRRTSTTPAEPIKGVPSSSPLPVDLATGVGYAIATEDRCTAFSDMLQHSGFGPDMLVNNDHEALKSMSPHRKRQLNEALSQIPRLDICQALIQVYFDEANWYFTMLDRFYFDEAYRRWTLCWNGKGEAAVDRNVIYFPALLFQVLAVALDYVPPTSACKSLLDRDFPQGRDSLASRWADAGETVMSNLGRRQPTLISVQADLVRCAWLKNAGHGAEGTFALSVFLSISRFC